MKEIDVLLAKAQAGDMKARASIIELYRYIAEVTIFRLRIDNEYLDKEDWVQEGVIAIIEAIDQYDPSKGTTFKSWVIGKVRNELREVARKYDEVPYSARVVMGEITKAQDLLLAEIGEMPSAKMIAEKLNTDEKRVREYMVTVGNFTNKISLDGLKTYASFESNGSGNDILIDDSVNIEEDRESAEIESSLAGYIMRLPEDEMNVICLYYYGDLTNKDIGTIIGKSGSRVYQLHTQALLRLRLMAQTDAELFV